MLDALTHSDLSAIHDLAIARARVDGHLSRPASTHERDTLADRLAARIAQLSPEAQAELLALVRLGRNGTRVDWGDLLAQSRDPRDLSTPAYLARHPELDACIERGLLALDGREA
jgi:hypothetical protein